MRIEYTIHSESDQEMRIYYRNEDLERDAAAPGARLWIKRHE
jgi:hypothetical protein